MNHDTTCFDIYIYTYIHIIFINNNGWFAKSSSGSLPQELKLEVKGTREAQGWVNLLGKHMSGQFITTNLPVGHPKWWWFSKGIPCKMAETFRLRIYFINCPDMYMLVPNLNKQAVFSMDGNDGDLQPIFHGKDLEPSETTTKKNGCFRFQVYKLTGGMPQKWSNIFKQRNLGHAWTVKIAMFERRYLLQVWSFWVSRYSVPVCSW